MKLVGVKSMAVELERQQEMSENWTRRRKWETQRRWTMLSNSMKTRTQRVSGKHMAMRMMDGHGPRSNGEADSSLCQSRGKNARARW